MKVKILLVPLFIVISIMLLIWLVYPAFSDLNDKRGELKDVGVKVADMEIKLQKTFELMNSMSEKGQEQEMVYNFLPTDQKIEEVIDILNNLAYSEGLPIADLSVGKPKVILESIAKETTMGDGMTGDIKKAVSEGSINDVREFEAEFSVVGGYDNLRNIINNINKTRRFNDIIDISINKSSSQTADSNLLNMDLIIKFNYLEKVKIVSSVNNKIFTSGEFETASLIEDMDRYRNGYYSIVVVDGVGKSNPFVR